mmetsp:Transcript_34060/g.93952  ORF Transcript_34060/g.93952 Transcript_34060/m.93952 type:complete len:223 (+) Transcript_34060:820-1488(+)
MSLSKKLSTLSNCASSKPLIFACSSSFSACESGGGGIPTPTTFAPFCMALLPKGTNFSPAVTASSLLGCPPRVLPFPTAFAVRTDSLGMPPTFPPPRLPRLGGLLEASAPRALREGIESCAFGRPLPLPLPRLDGLATSSLPSDSWRFLFAVTSSTPPPSRCRSKICSSSCCFRCSSSRNCSCKASLLTSHFLASAGGLPRFCRFGSLMCPSPERFGAFCGS